MCTAEGRDWWKANGHSIDLSFDLKEGSLNRRIWEAYLREKQGAKVEQCDFTDDDLSIADSIWDAIGRELRGQEGASSPLLSSPLSIQIMSTATVDTTGLDRLRALSRDREPQPGSPLGDMVEHHRR